MKALQDTTVALGRPTFVRSLGTRAAPTAAIARWRHSAKRIDVSPSNTIRLAMSLIDRRNARSNDGSLLGGGDQGGGISIFSPDEGFSVDVHGEADVIQLFLNQTYAEEVLGGPLRLPTLLNPGDDWMRSMVMKLLVRSTLNGPDDALLLEEGLHDLVVRIDRHATPWQERSEPPTKLFRGGLAPMAYRLVEEMIEAALDGAKSPTLAEMATIARLSVTHFTRAFRVHTGFTPHNYIVRRRLNRAIALVRIEGASISDVADKVGFSTPAHFVATFKTTMGVTPGAFRNALA
jgi:AraC family transcriptional regulator